MLATGIPQAERWRLAAATLPPAANRPCLIHAAFVVRTSH
jgi:hypothetical protein